jgi:hypothetical protein
VLTTSESFASTAQLKLKSTETRGCALYPRSKTLNANGLRRIMQMQTEAKNEALKLIAKAIQLIDEWHKDEADYNYDTIDDALDLLKQSVDKLAS